VLEALIAALDLCPEGGSRNTSFRSPDWVPARHEDLPLRRNAWRLRESYFLRAESCFNVASPLQSIDMVYSIPVRALDDDNRFNPL